MNKKYPKFINQKGKFHNIGDILCSPKHYYDFQLNNGSPEIVIIGGGAFSRLGVPEAKSLKPAKSVLWAVGRSTSIDKKRGLGIRSVIGRILNEIEVSRTHAIASVRDKCWARFGIRFVPCPSVHHPLTSIPPQDRLGVFINANTDVSGFDALKIVEIFCATGNSNTIVGSNGDDLESFIDDFSKTDRVITNSYHVCYWSLLTGRKVKLIGYSSKFVNLLKIFNISPSSLLIYIRGDGASLASTLKSAMHDTTPWISLRNPNDYKDQFKSINDEFASDIVKKGVFEKITKKEHIII